MNNLIKIVGLTLLISMSVFAGQRENVIQLVNNGIKYCEEKGIATCAKAFNAKESQFKKGELYLFLIDFDGTTLAHGGNPKLVGKDLRGIKSPSGSYPGKEFENIAKTKGEGWFDYKWSHPITKKITEKTTYIKRLGSDTKYIGSGFYK
jgi:signal transduction histidine kinase